MELAIKEYISQIELGEKIKFNNMAMVPLYTPHDLELEFISLNQALNQDLITITEVDESGLVPQLKVINHASIPVFLLDGEELIGAKQNRVLNTTILLKENSETIVPVSCTEEGRWSYQSSQFKDSQHLASSRVRRSKSISVGANLKTMNQFSSDQMAIWDEIKNTSHDAQYESPTSAMRDIYTSQEKKVEEYVHAFNIKDNQNGALVLINGEVMGLEILLDPSLYSNYHEKIMKSYALDAVLDNKSAKNQNDSSKKIKEFLEKTKTSQESTHQSVGYGWDYRFHNELSVGSCLLHQDHIMHMAFFRKPERIEKDSNMVSAYTEGPILS